jgi:SAM-dependent methyltransferase
VTAGGVKGGEPGYRLAAGREQAEDERLDLLEHLFDPGSRRRRDLVQPGWRCLEVGAGRGSMAAWLAERAGPAGQVVATDIDTRYLQRLGLPNLQVVQHNILDDPLDALGPGSFDLVCTVVAAEPRRHPWLGTGQRHHRSPRRRTPGAHRALRRPVGLVHHRAPARLLGSATRLTARAYDMR